MSKYDKPFIWMHGEISTPPFSEAARIEAGYLLRQLQKGLILSLPQSRPMPSIGTNCHELRINDENLSWRIVYKIYPDMILILEVSKKSPLKLRNLSSIPASKESGGLIWMSKKGINKMDNKKKRILESKGYKIGNAEDFLGLNKQETEYIELKLALSQTLAKHRKQKNLTQIQLAKILQSSQSRVAKMERGDPTVSIDLLIKSLLAIGATKESIAKALD
jgi:predicted XRE-type DNA-binding protein